MSKKQKQCDPSDMVHDTYRNRNAGVVDVPMNTKRSTSNFYLNRSTLGTHEVWDPTLGKFGGVRVEQNHIKQHARETMGELKHCSSSKEGNELYDPSRRGFREVTRKHGRPNTMSVPTPGRGY